MYLVKVSHRWLPIQRFNSKNTDSLRQKRKKERIEGENVILTDYCPDIDEVHIGHHRNLSPKLKNDDARAVKEISRVTEAKNEKFGVPSLEFQELFIAPPSPPLTQEFRHQVSSRLLLSLSKFI